MVDITRVKGFQLDTNARASMVPALSNMLHIPYDNAKSDFLDTGEQISRLVFDGAFIWGTASLSDKLIKINPQTTSLTDVTGVFSFPDGTAYDGDRFIWVVNRSDIAPANANVVKIDKLTGSMVATIPLPVSDTIITPVVTGAGGSFRVSGDRRSRYAPTVTFVVSGSTGNDGSYTVSTSSFALGSTTVVVTGSIPSAVADGIMTVNSTPNSIAFDGTFMWIAGAGTSSLYRIHAVTNAILEFSIASLSGTNPVTPFDVAFDGSHIWFACYGNLTTGAGGGVIKVDSSGAVVGTLLNPAGSGICFDGGSIWVGFDKLVGPNLLRIDSAEIGVMDVRSSLTDANTSLGRCIFDGKRYVWTGTDGNGAAPGLVRVDINTNEIFRITPASIGLVPPITSFTPNAFGFGLTFDGTHIWGSAFDTGNAAITGYVFRLVA